MTTPTDTHGLDPLRPEQDRLRARLARLRGRLRGELALEFAAEAVGVVVAVGAVLLALDWSFSLGLTARQFVLETVLVVLLPYLLLRGVRRWQATQVDDLALAVTIDRFRPGVGGRIADVLQLPDQLGERSASPALIRVAVQRAIESLDASDWPRLWNRGRTLKCAAALMGLVALPVLFGLVAPNVARLGASRWLLGSTERWPQKVYLSVVGLGDRDRLVAPRDEPFTLEVRSDLPDVQSHEDGWLVNGRGEPLVLSQKPDTPGLPATVRLRERTGKGNVRDAVMTSTSPAVFRHELPPSSSSTTFDLTGGDDWLGPIRVERVDRPSLAATRLRARDPGSPGSEFRAVGEGVQHPVFLPDTEVELTLVGSEPIADVQLTVHPGEPPKLTRVDPKTFRTQWTLREATTLEIQLTSAGTKLTSKPAFLSLGLQKDREPRVALRALGVGGRVTPVATIPLSFNATDDLGLASARLQLERITPPEGDKGEAKTSKTTVALPFDASRAVLDHQARHDVELQVEPPAVGTILRFVGEAEDRCARGAQVGRSGAVQMQVVAPDELFYEILIRQRAERAKFIGVLEAAEKQTPTLDGRPTAEAYTTAMRTLHTGSRQLEQIAGRIADTLQEMKLNQIGSPKSHRLLQEGVVDPIRALNAGPFAELRSVLQALSGSGPRTGADPESARRLNGEVVAKLKVILEQMSQWESFVDVVNQVAEVIKMQQNILKSAEKARETRTQEVFDEKP